MFQSGDQLGKFSQIAGVERRKSDALPACRRQIKAVVPVRTFQLNIAVFPNVKERHDILEEDML
ncbi:hypothetical protein D3C74_297860 [compost metagenome]